MSEVRISAEPRTEFGKGGARRTRRAGLVPAVLYGHGSDPRHISLPARAFAHALRTEAGLNVLLRVDLGGTEELALPKAVQRDPVRGDIEHADLLLVRRGERVTVDVPVVVAGDVVSGGLLDQQHTTLSVSADATAIPQSFTVDIAGLAVGDSVAAGAVPLPAGVELAVAPETVLVHVLASPTAEQVAAELAGAEAELGAGAAGATAAAATPAGAEPTGEGDVTAGEPAAEPDAAGTPAGS